MIADLHNLDMIRLDWIRGCTLLVYKLVVRAVNPFAQKTGAILASRGSRHRLELIARTLLSRWLARPPLLSMIFCKEEGRPAIVGTVASAGT